MANTDNLPAAEDDGRLAWNDLDISDVYLLAEAVIKYHTRTAPLPMSPDDMCTLAGRIRDEIRKLQPTYKSGDKVIYRSRDGAIRAGVVCGRPMSHKTEWEYHVVCVQRNLYNVHMRYDEWVLEPDIIELGSEPNVSPFKSDTSAR